MDYFCFYSPPDQQNISKTEKNRKKNLGFKKCRFRLTQPTLTNYFTRRFWVLVNTNNKYSSNVTIISMDFQFLRIIPF